jgi:hypothetical protein
MTRNHLNLFRYENKNENIPDFALFDNYFHG